MELIDKLKNKLQTENLSIKQIFIKGAVSLLISIYKLFTTVKYFIPIYVGIGIVLALKNPNNRMTIFATITGSAIAILLFKVEKHNKNGANQ